LSFFSFYSLLGVLSIPFRLPGAELHLDSASLLGDSVAASSRKKFLCLRGLKSCGVMWILLLVSSAVVTFVVLVLALPPLMAVLLLFSAPPIGVDTS